MKKPRPGNLRYLLLGLLVGVLLGVPGQAESVRFYLRNRIVSGRVVGQDVYLSREQLEALLLPEERKRLRWLGDDQMGIGDDVVTVGTGVSLQWVASRLGFVKRVADGSVDWVKIAEPKAGIPADQWRRRPEYVAAGRRLAEVSQSLPVSERADYQERVRKIGTRVAAASPLGEMPWNFVVVEMSAPNAACTGEGHVFVTTGLLEMGISDEELAGVLGHEVAHGVRRHVVRRYELWSGIQRLLLDYQQLQTRIDRGETTLKLREQVARYARQRDDLQYRYEHEKFYTHLDEEEADVLGMRYAVAAGYPAEGLGQCLEKLERLRVTQFGTAVLRDDMSHPPTARRLEILIIARRNAGY